MKILFEVSRVTLIDTITVDYSEHNSTNTYNIIVSCPMEGGGQLNINSERALLVYKMLGEALRYNGLLG